MKKINVLDWGLVGYNEALRRQTKLVEERVSGLSGDSLVFLEHHKTVTIGCSGGYDDLLVSETILRNAGIELFQVDRGGKATFHEPGQLVVYPIIKLEDNDLPLYVRTLLEASAAVLQAYGLNPMFKDGKPGLWVRDCKIVSIGVSLKQGVTYHGLAINVNNDLTGFQLIVPCGHRGETFTSIMREHGEYIEMAEVKNLFANEFKGRFLYYDESEQDSQNS
jgi:lipoate-protein ligase B